ncbi:MAG: hypothetical protein SOV26_02250 [Candidatus Onthovivens sp.]|nr:hypothetical protein [Candidatus Onthovivens sp.]
MYIQEEANGLLKRKKAILDYYFSHGENCSIAVRVFGYPSLSSMKD